MTAVPPEIRIRAIKLLGMLGSAHDGERAAAAFLVNKLLRENNLTWEDVWPIPASTSSTPPPPPPEPDTESEPVKPQPSGYDQLGRYLFHVRACLWQTALAWLFLIGDAASTATLECWLPKSQCEYLPDSQSVAIPGWLCVAKGLL